eukprot:2457978-Rhodomonas_salina.9
MQETTISVRFVPGMWFLVFDFGALSLRLRMYIGHGHCQCPPMSRSRFTGRANGCCHPSLSHDDGFLTTAVTVEAAAPDHRMMLS